MPQEARRIPRRTGPAPGMIAVFAVAFASFTGSASQRPGGDVIAASKIDSAPELTWAYVERLLAAKRALERTQQTHPDAQLPAVRLPIEPPALERALTRSPRLTGTYATRV